MPNATVTIDHKQVLIPDSLYNYSVSGAEVLAAIDQDEKDLYVIDHHGLNKVGPYINYTVDLTQFFTLHKPASIEERNSRDLQLTKQNLTINVTFEHAYCHNDVDRIIGTYIEEMQFNLENGEFILDDMDWVLEDV